MKLRSDTFKFMRKVPPDLSRYLPKYLYSDEVFFKIQNALNEEHKKFWLKFIDTAKEFYIQTASENGLSDWERFLKITPKKNADTELRRALVSIKRRGGQMMTVEHTKEVMREFARYGEVDIAELGENKLKLIINNGDFEWDELMAALWELLPAHLIFDFGIYEDFGEEVIHYAQATADATAENFELDMLSPPPENIRVGIYPVDISTDIIDIDSSDEHSEHADYLQIAVLTQAAEFATFDCDRSEIMDEDTAEDFERYLRERWKQFKDNPVIKYYKHGTHGEDGEINEPDEEEFFPVETDFLRIYWAFNCPNDKDGAEDDKFHYRYQTIINPRENVSAADINHLSAIGANSKMLLHSKLNLPTIGIIKALYIQKQEIKVW